MKEDSKMKSKILSREAALYDSSGYLVRPGLTVIDRGRTIQIGITEHSKTDLEQLSDQLISIHGWYVIL